MGDARAEPRGFAVARFEPSPRGAGLFVLDAIDLDGHLRPAIGATYDWAYKPLVAASSDGTERFAVIRHQMFARASASLILFHRLRLALDVPVAIHQDGDDAPLPSDTVIAPTRPALGDPRVAADVRVVALPRRALSVAVGARVWAPFGPPRQYAGDGAVRAGAHASAYGRLGPAFWAARLGATYRARDDVFVDGHLGSALEGAIAAGVVVLSERVVAGPELWGSTGVTSRAFGRRETPAEALLGIRIEMARSLWVGAAGAVGLGEGLGSPRTRLVASVEWAPAYVVPDRDHDDVLDAVDACPDVPGERTDDPETNGCPPPPPIPDEDTDGDGIVDRRDACPGVAGPPSADPRTNGCPPRPTAPEAPPPTAVVTDAAIVIREAVLFVTDSAELAPESTRVLAAVADVLDKHPELLRVRVEGHTDSSGDATHNDDLSARRAASVVAWLVARGVAAGRLDSAGYGSRAPIADNGTEAGRAQNRRVVFTIVERAAPTP